MAKKKAQAEQLTVYSVAKKSQVVVNPKTAYLTKNPNGSFMLRGEDVDGAKVAGIVGAAKAETYITQFGLKIKEN